MKHNYDWKWLHQLIPVCHVIPWPDDSLRTRFQSPSWQFKSVRQSLRGPSPYPCLHSDPYTIKFWSDSSRVLLNWAGVFWIFADTGFHHNLAVLLMLSGTCWDLHTRGFPWANSDHWWSQYSRRLDSAAAALWHSPHHTRRCRLCRGKYQLIMLTILRVYSNLSMRETALSWGYCSIWFLGRRYYSIGGPFLSLCLSVALCIVAKRCKICL